MAAIDLNAKFTASGGSDNDSRKWMKYTADSGEVFGVFISENAGEVFGFDDILDADISLPQLPRRFKMRQIHAQSSDGKVKNSFPIGKTSEAIYMNGGTILVARKGIAAGLSLTATGTTGEKRTFLAAGDTGQSSGDAT